MAAAGMTTRLMNRLMQLRMRAMMMAESGGPMGRRSWRRRLTWIRLLATSGLALVLGPLHKLLLQFCDCCDLFS